METELRNMINDYIREIGHLSQMQIYSTTDVQMDYFQNLINERTEDLINLILNYIEYQGKSIEEVHSNEQEVPQTEYTLEELAAFDGAQGRPAYVAINGMVYDVSLVGPWAGGTHFGQTAGQDLTMQFNSCHSGIMEILRNVPIVGVLKE